MGNQPSRRSDGFGTAGIGEDSDDRDMGTGGHSSMGGTGSRTSGGTQGNDAGVQRRKGNPANVQGPEAANQEKSQEKSK
jgi:hypothetical protein